MFEAHTGSSLCSRITEDLVQYFRVHANAKNSGLRPDLGTQQTNETWYTLWPCTGRNAFFDQSLSSSYENEVASAR